MDTIGIDIRKDSWAIAHVRSTPISVKVKGGALIAGDSYQERLNGLKDYISANNLKGVRIAVGLPRESSISKVIEIPAPNAQDLQGILRFEFEKHMPFQPDEAYYGFQILRKRGKVYSVVLAAAKKNTVNKIIEEFMSAEMEPFFIGTSQTSFYNALQYRRMIPGSGNTAIISLSGSELTLDIFSEMVPLYSRYINISGLKKDQVASLIKRELKFSVCSAEACMSSKVEEGFIVSDDEVAAEDLRSELSREMNIPVKIKNAGDIWETVSATAMGLSLGALGRGAYSVNLSPSLPLQKNKTAPLSTVILSALFFLLLVVIGGSYLTRDLIKTRMLDFSISEMNGKREKMMKISDSLKRSEALITVLEDIKGVNSPSTLYILKELTEILPRDTWLTGFEYSGDTIYIDGLSDRASLLLLKMEKSGFMNEFDFTGPVTKMPDGKEHFRIRLRINQKKDAL